MPEHPSTDERPQAPFEDLRRDAPVFAVAPIRARSRLPFIAIVGLMVGVLAFVAGLGVASSGPAQRPGRSDRPVIAFDSPVPGSVLEPAGSSAFATSFRPAKLVSATPGGERCTSGEPREKEVPRTRRDGPRLTFQRSWLIWCPIPEDRRQAFLVDMFEALVDVIPADTYGYGAADAGPGDALFPYAQPPLTGTVAVTADAAGTGFAIAIVLEEWRSDEAR